MHDLFVDSGSFESWDSSPPRTPAQSPEYAQDLRAARERSGVDEAITTGEATIGGRRVAVILNHFGFLGGSIGAIAADRVVAAFQRATREALPVVAVAASGGTRMQEGTSAFLRMVDISRALLAHRLAGLPSFMHLTHPTTGGVLASWGSLGQFTTAESRALIGFLGPRVQEALTGSRIPEGVQRSETLEASGLIDAVVRTDELAGWVTRVLDVLSSEPQSSDRPPSSDLTEVDAWAAVVATRDPARPGVRDVLLASGRDTTLLAGGTLRQRGALVVALTTLAGTPCIVVGQDRESERNGSTFGIAELREVRRTIVRAQELGLPVVFVIDTAGAEVSVEAEEGGIAAEIARTLEAVMSARTPTVSILLGQGTGGGALALFPADRVIAAERAWLAPLSPEGVCAVRGEPGADLTDLARRLRMSVSDLQQMGAVHAVVREDPDRSLAVDIAAAAAAELHALEARIS